MACISPRGEKLSMHDVQYSLHRLLTFMEDAAPVEDAFSRRHAFDGTSKLFAFCMQEGSVRARSILMLSVSRNGRRGASVLHGNDDEVILEDIEVRPVLRHGCQR